MFENLGDVFIASNQREYWVCQN